MGCSESLVLGGVIKHKVTFYGNDSETKNASIYLTKTKVKRFFKISRKKFEKIEKIIFLDLENVFFFMILYKKV